MIFKNSKLLLTVFSLITIILLFALIIGVYSIRAKNQKISELINLATQASEVEVMARSIRAVQNSAKEDLEAFDDFVLSDDKLVALIESIEAVGQTLDLETKIVSVSKIEDKKVIVPDMIYIAMETQGPWAGTFSFLHAIENLPHRVKLDKLSLSKEEDGWHLAVTLVLYSFD
ncbi:MAG: hypothetical protein A3C70_00715 [Candidatus Zambryskibacteria bacterium RIFCSPHIGHO2_02_FULL_43_14]|uniref:Uncharacterized protein n=1 Tax=Candidatus Zambryskibacteria bacterium RIFCSPHIGHO2_02_FULL_43_14 TaxID=1802748 RepID=A0A1G2TE25_9BACT|nr:MAG: hypothetical protein A2829_02760 [Candidatus Zambryskibacteria bacterium RIFCSPHIGHO2_01_FULL_43_60]OHA95536.1 MAG: hypothetical protein A3C70_00715 [Candidatus Zambryskibacteria bacterium RIFCSPHIGHO2_02_FULL_43_14]OHB02890.1 MAG: hypothetical protein A3B03_03155 [Candidatus Zambryskibacteria bacterium RIFCSPLOWO2_01_FULL_42_41]